MSVIKIVQVGGVLPSVSPRALPNGTAQTAQNLLARTSEFRPMAQDLAVATSGVANPKTLHRLSRTSTGAFNTDMTTGWVVNAAVVNYVKGQLDDDATERTYYTFGDGSAPPRVLDATGQDRQLGVPQPAAQPAVTVNVVDEFTSDERSTSIDANLQKTLDAILGSVSPLWLGYTHPGIAVPGLADRGGGPAMTLDVPESSEVLRIFRLSSVSTDTGTITDTYSNLSAANASWVMNLPGFFVVANSDMPSWTGNTNDHWCVPLAVYGKTMSFDAAAATTAIAAIPMPGATDGSPMYSTERVNSIITAVQQAIDPAGDNTLKPKLDALNAKAIQVIGMFDGSSEAALNAAVTAFYNATALPEIQAAQDAFAEAIWRKAEQVALAQDASSFV